MTKSLGTVKVPTSGRIVTVRSTDQAHRQSKFKGVAMEFSRRGLGLVPLLVVSLIAGCSNDAEEPRASLQLDRTCWTTSLEGAGVSSPAAADLTGDSVLDVVVASGSADPKVVAIDGGSGRVLWSAKQPAEAFTTPAFVDSNGDGTPDVIMGGRSADLVSLDGRTGRRLWSVREDAPDLAELWFGTPTTVEDRDGDRVADLLVAQAGDEEDHRLPGSLVVVSGRSGRILSAFALPDGGEVYGPPSLDPARTLSDQQTIVGTGGETVPGHLYALRFDEAGRPIPEWSVSIGGVIAHPVLTEAFDGRREAALFTTWEGEVGAVDVASGDLLWKQQLPGMASSAPPVAGRPAPSEPPVVIATLAKGTAFPAIGGDTSAVWFDARNGSIIREVDLDGFSSSDPILFDFDSNGRQELLISVVGREESAQKKSSLRLLDANTGEELTRKDLIGFTVATPLVADLEGDSAAELIYIDMEGAHCLHMGTPVAEGSVVREYRRGG